jgi:hypothetical protein
MPQQTGFDFAQLYPVTPDFDLLIETA